MNNSIIKESISATILDQEDFSNRNNLVSYIKNNSDFLEKYDLCEFINNGSTGYIYKGYYKGIKKRQVALKFLIDKKKKRKEGK